MSDLHRIYQYEMITKLRQVSSHGSALKQEIFKAAIVKSKVDPIKVKSFLNFTNVFLKSWEEYADHLTKIMAESKGSENVHTWSYQNIKDFIYQKYDYASIIQFINEVHNLISNGDDVTVDDISALFSKTITTAFDDMPDSTAGLIDTYLNASADLYVVKTDKVEAKMYDTVKSYRKMFDPNARSVLYRAISKAVELLSDPSSIEYVKNGNMRLFSSIINNIIEYMVYSISFYALRIYLIGNYAYPFIDRCKSEAFGESTETKNEDKIDDLPVLGTLASESMSVNVMKCADELKCRDFNNLSYSIDIFNTFAEAIGALALIDGKPLTLGRYVSMNDVNQKNMFGSRLINNPLFIMIADRLINGIEFDKKTIEETNQILRASAINDNHGMDSATTDKHEILHIINGVGDQSSVKNCQEIAADLVKFNFIILSNIKNGIEFFQKYGQRFENPRGDISSLSERKLILECATMLKDLYKDISVAILRRARAIEMSYNHLISNKDNDLTKKFSLDIRPKTTSDAIPDTTRMPIELMDLYTLPAFESMELYDEYLRSTPLMENDIYLSEAFSLSSIFNTIKSLLQAFIKRIATFVNDKKVKRAVDWVKNNEQKLRSMNIEGALKMKVHPYAETRNDKNGMDINKGIKNLRANISSVNPEDSNLKVEEFITSLYPSANVQKWWDEDVKKGNQMYHNYIVFGVPEGQVKADIMQEVELTTGNIKDVIVGFIESVKSLDSTYNSLTQIGKDIEAGVNKIQQATVKATSNQSQQNNAGDSVNSAETNNQQNNQQNQNNQSNQQNDANKMEAQGTDKLQLLANGTQTAINRLWVPIAGIVINTIVDQYKVIQKVYSIANSSSNNQNNK